MLPAGPGRKPPRVLCTSAFLDLEPDVPVPTHSSPPSTPPPGGQALLYVPGSHFVNNQAGLLPDASAAALSAAAAAGRGPTRAEFGLPEGGALVAGLNAFFKVDGGAQRRPFHEKRRAAVYGAV